MWESEVVWGRFYFCYLLLLSSWSSSSLSILHLYLIWNSLSRSSWFVQYWDTKVGVSEDFLSTDLVFRVIAIYQTIEEKTKTVRIIFPLHVTEEDSKKNDREGLSRGYEWNLQCAWTKPNPRTQSLQRQKDKWGELIDKQKDIWEHKSVCLSI